MLQNSVTEWHCPKCKENIRISAGKITGRFFIDKHLSKESGAVCRVLENLYHTDHCIKDAEEFILLLEKTKDEYYGNSTQAF